MNRYISAIVGAGLLASALASPLNAVAEELLDCPMRDAPFSTATPLIDIMLSDEASAIVREQLPQMFENLPPDMFKTTAPSFGAIINLQGIAGMMHLPEGALAPLETRLAAIEVSDEDRQRRCQRYDDEAPALTLADDRPNVMVFRKINGFDHGPSVDAAVKAVEDAGRAHGWNVLVTDRAGAFNPDLLGKIDVVVWNNNSGDVLTLTQRAAFESYINDGGVFLGLHGAGGDFAYDWNWYRDVMLGAQFIGHPMEPQFQDGEVVIESTGSGIGADLAPGWRMNEEWYSFASNPRDIDGVTVVATLDEDSYQPVGFGGQDLRMGEDHPIVWHRCVGQGRAAYTAIGHRVEVYDVPKYRQLLDELLVWSVTSTECARR